MQKFRDLYVSLTKAALKKELEEAIKKLEQGSFDSHHLDCLLNPGRKTVIALGNCECDDEESSCLKACAFDAVKKDKDGRVQINPEACRGCGACIDACKGEKLTESKQTLPLLQEIYNGTRPVYAMIAPAFIGQFPDEVTPGKLRAAFKSLGFAGMVEVALFADILTLKEALEFDRAVQKETDYLLTSCCCPVWLSLCRKAGLMEHIPGSVSPMVACGRSIKRLHPDAVTVFIGPCLAKKKEATEPDVADAVDYVLTFQEMLDIFEFAELDLEAFSEDDREHSSRAGRIYAYSGGVSEAVKDCLTRLRPERKLPLKAEHADGVRGCRALLDCVMQGEITANFIEGMGCEGGCVGGPRVLADKEDGKAHVARYGDEATYASPAENPYVIELLHRLGFQTVEELLEKDDIFTRHFN
ncbi:MAG: iron hydrogenase [Ruminococcaceae bacterium]|nr:iron hydrogenase [Oscillospiraceae bacterium]